MREAIDAMRLGFLDLAAGKVARLALLRDDTLRPGPAPVHGTGIVRSRWSPARAR